MYLATRSFALLFTGILVLLAACAGDSVDFKTPPVPEGLALQEAGLDPETQQPRTDNPNLLEEATAFVVARDAATVSVHTAVVEIADVGDDFDPSGQTYEKTALTAVSEPDQLGWVRWEVGIPSRSTSELLVYWFELEDDTGLPLLFPEEGPAAAVTVQPIPFEIDFEWPVWPDLHEPLECVPDVSRIFDDGPNERTLVPGQRFEVVRKPVWVRAEEQTVVTSNLANVRTGIGVEWDGEYYFLPLAVMLWNEVANHQMGDRQLATSYCPLTDTALLFDTGFDPLNLPRNPYFGPAGLYNSNLSVGRQDMAPGEATAFNQMMGFGFTGPQVEECLRPLPSILTSFGFWKKMHPETWVLEGDRNGTIDYISRSNPYDLYWRSEELRAPVAFREPTGQERLFLKERVLGIMGAGDPLAIALPRGSWIHHDRVQNTPIVVFYQGKTAFCLEARLPDTGLELRFERANAAWNGVALYKDDQSEPSLWTPEGVAISGPLRGRRLAWVPSMSAFWFAWYTMYPETRFVAAPGD